MNSSSKEHIIGLSKLSNEAQSVYNTDGILEDGVYATEDSNKLNIKSEFYKNNNINHSFGLFTPNEDESTSHFSNSTIITYSMLIIATAVIGFILQYLKEVLVPFVIAIFLYYLIKPLVLLLTKPFQIYWFSALIPDDLNDIHSPLVDNTDTNQLLSYSNSNNENNKMTKNLKVSKSIHDKEKKTLPSNGDLEDNYTKQNIYSGRENLPWYHMELINIRLPRLFGILLSILIIIAIIIAITFFIVSSLEEFQSKELTIYTEEAKRLVKEFTSWLKTVFHIDISQLIDYFTSMIPVSTLISSVLVFIYTFACDSFWVILFLLYLLFEDTSKDNNESSLTNHQRVLKSKVNEQIERYIVIKTLISVLVGVLVYIVLGPILNVKLSSVWGVLTFFFNYIPNVGPFFAIIVSIPVIILDKSLSFLCKVLAFIIPFLIHAIVGNIVEPKAFGSSLELHPIVVLLCLSIWYVLWGITGAILSVPITAIIRIFLTSLDYPAAALIVRWLEGNIWNTNPPTTQEHYYSELPIETESIPN